MKTFKKFIEKYSVLPNDEWEIIERSFVRQEFPKDALILAEGKICRHFYFLEEGLVRFFMQHEAEDITTYFVEGPYCFTSKESIHNCIPAKESIQALCRCMIWKTTTEQLSILSKLPAWERFMRSFLHEVQGYFEQLMITTKIKSAEERYLDLIESHPDITDRIPLKYLASFLGIAPQSLSRIRKKHQKNA